MSGLEALGIFGVVCNVLQVISSARETVSLCKAIYQGQAPDAHLKDNATHLSELSEKLKTHYAPQRTSDEKDLARIAEECRTAAQKLVKEVCLLTDN